MKSKGKINKYGLLNWPYSKELIFLDAEFRARYDDTWFGSDCLVDPILSTKARPGKLVHHWK